MSDSFDSKRVTMSNLSFMYCCAHEYRFEINELSKELQIVTHRDDHLSALSHRTRHFLIDGEVHRFIGGGGST